MQIQESQTPKQQKFEHIALDASLNIRPLVLDEVEFHITEKSEHFIIQGTFKQGELSISSRLKLPKINLTLVSLQQLSESSALVKSKESILNSLNNKLMAVSAVIEERMR